MRALPSLHRRVTDHSVGFGASGTGRIRKEKGMKDELREMPPLLTPQQLADMTGGQVNVSTVRRKCAAGEIPAVKVGKKWFVVRDRLLETA